MFGEGVLDTAGLPEYPYRDDALSLWYPFHRWIEGYVELYYGSDGDVTSDRELADFLRTLGAPDGGNLKGIPQIEDVAALAKFIATLCWIGSAQHSAVNYTQ